MHCLVYSAHDLFSRSHAIYDAILPAGGGVRAVLQHARLGVPTERWFARKVPAEDVVSRYYHLFTTSLIVAMAKIYGAGAAMPEFLDTEEIGRIVCWIAAERKRGRSCCVKAAASGATRIAQAAWQMGVSLEGTKFRVGGEPFTESKRDALKRVGAAAVPDYAFEGGGPVGVGCANPTHLDEMHVQQHIMALIAHPKLLDAGASTVRSLLCTTIHSGYARLLFNVENGDYASFERRDCECLLEKVGLKLHVHHIRSYEKFTSEGMNYFYGDLFEFVETTLPSEFGGGPGDYQLVEEEDDNGRTRITLLVHPAVGELDEEKVMRRFRTRLAEGSSAQRFQAETWRNAGTLRVRRQPPYASPAGKILPLHISR